MFDEQADDHHPDEHRRDDADRFHIALVANCVGARPRRGARSRAPISCSMSGSTVAPRWNVIWSSTVVASMPTHAARSGVLATWPFSRASRSRFGVGFSVFSLLSPAPWSSPPPSADAERGDGVVHEVADRGRDRAGPRARRRSSATIDAQREREREHVEARRGAGEQAERAPRRGTGSRAPGPRPRSRRRGTAPRFFVSMFDDVGEREPRAGTTLNERNHRSRG